MTDDADPLLIELPMPIVTPRLLLRPARPGDGAALLAARCESWAELSAWPGFADGPVEALSEATEEVLARKKAAAFILRETVWLLAFTRDGTRLLGAVELYAIDWPARVMSVGYWIRTRETGQGFATEMVNAVVRYAFGALGANRMAASHAEGNERSRRVINRLGLVREGTTRRYYLVRGQLGDAHHYARFDVEGLPPLEVSWGAAGRDPPPLTSGAVERALRREPGLNHPEPGTARPASAMMVDGTVLRGPRVVLRPPGPNDAAGRLALGRNPEITRMFGADPADVPSLTATGAAHWVETLSRHPHAWVVEHDGRLLGEVRLDDVDPQDKRARLAIGLYDPARLGMGLGREAIRLALAHAFGPLGLHRVGLRVVAYNTRAIRCYRACGFVVEGREREAARVGGAWHDDVIMGALASEHPEPGGTPLTGRWKAGPLGTPVDAGFLA